MTVSQKAANEAESKRKEGNSKIDLKLVFLPIRGFGIILINLY